MPKMRFIEWAGRSWRLSELAASYALKPQTLASRLDRGYDLRRALSTGLCSKEEAARRAIVRYRRAR